MLLIKVYNNRIENFNQLSSKIFSKKIGFLIDGIITFSLYTGFSVMVAGSGAIFKEQLGLSFNIGIIVMIICCFIVFLFSLEGLSFISSILVPLLVIGIVFTSYYISKGEGYDFSLIEGVKLTSKGNFITSALLYFGANALLIIVVFSSLLPIIDSKKTAILGGLVGGIILYFLAISILNPMLIFYDKVHNLDMPMLQISSFVGEGYRKIYAAILWIAIFTTALANGFGFVNKFPSKSKMKAIIILCVSAIPLAKFGFANLVGIIYPIFGFAGVIIMGLVLIKIS
ncbi:MAG: hypothetical protein RIN55_11480 [Tissierellaceae bacterium]|nr:hypothetical protein [Tissierellaceae bacterium]